MGTLLQIAGGLVLLGLGGEGMVRSAVGLARRLGLSELLIGIAVGLGGALPELLTSINAALHGATAIAVGNVVGSNISNVLLIVGLAAFLRPLPVESKALERDGAALMFLSVAAAGWSIWAPAINWIGGVVMLALLAGYIVFTYRTEKRAPNASKTILHQIEAQHHKTMGLPLTLAVAAASIAALVVGAEFLVRGGVALAESAHVPQTFIGLTVVAIGTSLPELAACVTASLRGRPDLVLGTIIGSCIYNVLGVLGATALVAPVHILHDFTALDWVAFVGAPVLLVGHAATGERISKVEGGFMLTLYALYVWQTFSHIAPDGLPR